MSFSLCTNACLGMQIKPITEYLTFLMTEDKNMIRSKGDEEFFEFPHTYPSLLSYYTYSYLFV